MYHATFHRRKSGDLELHLQELTIRYARRLFADTYPEDSGILRTKAGRIQAECIHTARDC